MSIGFRVLRCAEKIQADLVRKFAAIPVANVSDNMQRIVAAGPRVRPMHAHGLLAGPALTVKTRPGDNLLVHKALDMAESGDVVVVDGGGDLTNALVGELMVTYAETRGLAGLVINGAIRDFRAIHSGTFPVYAVGVTHRGPYKSGPGEINVRIAIDGMVIEPGDLIIGDEDGVLCVPRGIAEEIYQRAKAQRDAETRTVMEIKAGALDRMWVDDTLERLGCDLHGS